VDNGYLPEGEIREGREGVTEKRMKGAGSGYALIKKVRLTRKKGKTKRTGGTKKSSWRRTGQCVVASIILADDKGGIKTLGNTKRVRVARTILETIQTDANRTV